MTIFATLLAWLGARITIGLPKRVRRLALATFLGTLAQAPLGALTVYSGLNPLLVMTHFLLALVVLAAGVVVFIEALALEQGVTQERLPLQLRRGSVLLAAALLALVVSGTVATAAGPHPGSADVRRLWHLHAAVQCTRPRRTFWPAVPHRPCPLLCGTARAGRVPEDGRIAVPARAPDGDRRVAVLNAPAVVVVLVHVSLAAAVWAAVYHVARAHRPPRQPRRRAA